MNLGARPSVRPTLTIGPARPKREQREEMARRHSHPHDYQPGKIGGPFEGRCLACNQPDDAHPQAGTGACPAGCPICREAAAKLEQARTESDQARARYRFAIALTQLGAARRRGDAEACAYWGGMRIWS